MQYQHILYERDGRCLRLTLNRPEKRNALSVLMLQELLDALERADREKKICCMVFRGAGDKAFCAGADLGDMGEQKSDFEDYERRGLFAQLFSRILAHSKVSIAAVNGHCLAGGLGLALACDLAIVKQGAKVGTPEIARGLFPFMISSLILRTVSRRVAHELMYLGRLLTAKEAVEVGLFNRFASSEAFDAEVEEWLERLCGFSPAVLELGKKGLTGQRGMTIQSALPFLQGLLCVNAKMSDAQEGIRAFFEKRTPVFKGE